MKPLKPAQAAKVFGSNSESVRVRMQRNLFDPAIGTACLKEGCSRYSFEIYPEKLAAYLNISVEEVMKRVTE